MLVPLHVLKEGIRKFTIRGHRFPTDEEYKTLTDAYKTKDISMDVKTVFLDLLGSIQSIQPEPAEQALINTDACDAL